LRSPGKDNKEKMKGVEKRCKLAIQMPLGLNDPSENWFFNTPFGKEERNEMERKKIYILRIFSPFPCLEV
jgi:hypothetical protein